MRDLYCQFSYRKLRNDMSKMIEYKGYIGTVEFSESDALFYGKVLGIRELISYEGEDEEELISDFQNAVDYYLGISKSQIA